MKNLRAVILAEIYLIFVTCFFASVAYTFDLPSGNKSYYGKRQAIEQAYHFPERIEIVKLPFQPHQIKRYREIFESDVDVERSHIYAVRSQNHTEGFIGITKTPRNAQGNITTITALGPYGEIILVRVLDASAELEVGHWEDQFLDQFGKKTHEDTLKHGVDLQGFGVPPRGIELVTQHVRWVLTMDDAFTLSLKPQGRATLLREQAR